MLVPDDESHLECALIAAPIVFGIVMTEVGRKLVESLKSSGLSSVGVMASRRCLTLPRPIQLDIRVVFFRVALLG